MPRPHSCEASSCSEPAAVLLANPYGAHVYLCRWHWARLRGRNAPGLHITPLPPVPERASVRAGVGS
jgi:hypothetical protein